MTSIRTLLIEDGLAVGVGRGVVEGWNLLPPRFCTLWAACEMFDKSAICVALLAAGEADGAVRPSGRVVVMWVILPHVYQPCCSGVEGCSTLVAHHLVVCLVIWYAVERWYGLGILVWLQAVVP